ncbi:MAG: TIGR04211 family SH3 domain-containing protein [Pseudomonadota bacterium]|nr:MAG: TIGR04211 family SH3 domain-containing protein [Pseudomonadota bacterium]
MLRNLAILAVLSCVAVAASAQDTRFVSDELRITMRTGQGNQHRIVKMLTSGQRLELLKQSDEGYSKVRTADGTEGWVRTQYLMAEPVASEKLAAAEQRLAAAQAETQKLKTELGTLRKAKNQLASERTQLSQQASQLEKEVSHLSEVSARPIQLDKENKRLKEMTVSLEKDLELRMQENQVLKDKSDREWFMVGAAIMLLGIILGLVIPKIRWRKKSSWDL